MTVLSESLRPPESRLASLDVFRGFTMFLLIAESTQIYSLLIGPGFRGTFIEAIGNQFHHHPWNGLRFWDLIQPFFMFIVGVALPFSVAKREARGEARPQIVRHAVTRSLVLLLLGWALYCIEPGRITFRFQNVLAQLSVTYLIAFLIMRRSARAQVVFAFGLLAATELAYRIFPVGGFNQPFLPDHNLGSYVDLLISGELSSGHWVSLNAIPTAAHTIWGVLAGQCLMSDRPAKRKVGTLALAGLAGLTLGYALNPVTPIIKRIATSSFVIVSGGWCLVALAFTFWLVDVRRIRTWSKFLAVVGMNSLAIYLFTESGGTAWVRALVKPFVMGFLSWTGEWPAKVLTSGAAWAVLWLMCYWLFKKKIFIKI